MVSTKGITRTVEKWKARVAVAGTDYTTGINTAPSWSAAAAAAKDAWAAGVQAAVSRGAFASGVSAAGDAKWKAAATQLGAGRYTPGVNFGAPYYQSKMTGVLSTIEGVSLAPRGPAGSEGNYALSRQVGDALHAAKLATKG